MYFDKMQNEVLQKPEY